MGNVKIPNWVKGLPLAPEFYPTATEFVDPIGYISKIEKEASEFGICKIIPPLPRPSKKYVFSNLNRSLAKRPELGCNLISKSDGSDGEVRAVFTTRHQELGQNSNKRGKGPVVEDPTTSSVAKQVWQSGEVYTLEQFESKARSFSRSILGTSRDVSPLVVEAMFWKAASEKPMYIEYANDVPGSAFEEPEGVLFYSHRRRRKRNSYQRSGPDSDSINSSERNSRNCEGEEAPTCSEVPKLVSTDESSRKRSQNSSSDMEGTAGWKLSNSPWNLQVIARSPGSLTRFMPDDIPGVTSPMVYIGMLFSWFAWHVEDHELHSMNFLHNGSAKTWYSVPGDYAYDFEELVRNEAYGGTADRLAALSLLSNKTTLMSPEVVIKSRNPCFRLIQNPGEFVDFSKGLPCRIQSRVPRSLLPGVRSSRMKDRQKEDRELSVKKAFIEDILNENNVVSALLEEKSGCRAVVWNPDLLPYTCKESLAPTTSAPVDKFFKENVVDCEGGNSADHQNLLVNEMSLYMENLNDFYLGSDDLSSDFQVDAGSLACVACGILGFPFMSVLQPSDKASMELHSKYKLSEESRGVLGNSHCSPEHHPLKGCDAEYVSPISNASSHEKNPPLPCTTTVNSFWNTVDKFRRPRSFCLEHAVEILELLQCKGGANMLVICHSDYQKIKAPAAAIAEEIGFPFEYNEVPLDVASKEDLSLIDLAVDDGYDEYGEDWTSTLGINLQYCVKVRKCSSSKRVQHALALGEVFSKQSCSSECLTGNWKSRRSRTRKVLNAPLRQSESLEKKKGELVEPISIDATPNKREAKVLQYSRRNKQKPSTDTGSRRVVEHPATSEELDKHNRRESKSISLKNGKSMSEMHPDVEMLGTNMDNCLDSTLSEVADTMASTAGSVEVQIENHTLEERNIDGGGCSSAASESDMQADIMILKEARELIYTDRHVNALDGTVEKHREEQESNEVIKNNDDCCMVSAGQSQISAMEDVQINVQSVPTNLTKVCAADSAVSSSEEQGLKAVIEESRVNSEKCESTTLNDEAQQEDQSNNKAPVSCSSTLLNDSTIAAADCHIEFESDTRNGATSTSLVQQDSHTSNEVTGSPSQIFSEQEKNHPLPVSLEDEVSRVSCATEVTLDNKEQRTKSDSQRELLASDDTSKCELSHVTIKTYFRVKRGTHAAQESCKGNEPSVVDPRQSPGIGSKRKRRVEHKMDDDFNMNGYMKGPCEGLRPRAGKDATVTEIDIDDEVEEKPVAKVKRPSNVSARQKNKEQPRKTHSCNLGSCSMSFQTKEELAVHKRNRCPHEGCGKKFSCHKYAMVHSRVHENARPFKCLWKGCSMSFKWAWDQTEHIRVTVQV